MMTLRLPVFLIGLWLVSVNVHADPVVKLTSLEWPPYSGEKLPQQGASVDVVRRAFSAAGFALETTFYPWTRAVNLARDSSQDYRGYYPEYQTDETEQRCLLSDPVGVSPLGFIEPASAPVRWETLTDLQGLNIGVVQDYVNTSEFDARVAAGELTTTTVIRDQSSLQMVAAQRLDLAVMDSNVFRFLSAGTGMAFARDKVRFNDRLLEYKSLHVCFNPGEEALRDAFNSGLKTLQPDVLQREYLEQHLHQ